MTAASRKRATAVNGGSLANRQPAHDDADLPPLMHAYEHRSAAALCALADRHQLAPAAGVRLLLELNVAADVRSFTAVRQYAEQLCRLMNFKPSRRKPNASDREHLKRQLGIAS